MKADRRPAASGSGPSRGSRGSDRPVPTPKPARRSPSEPRPSQEGGRGGAAAGGRAHPARWEPEGLSSDPNPRSVTPGIETQPGEHEPGPDPLPVDMPPPGIHVRLDWMRFVGREHQFDRLKALLLETFGPVTSESTGAQWFRGGLNWHPGVTLSYGHSKEIIQLDVRGERLTITGTDFAVDLLRRVYELLGFYATRLDAALDFVGQGLSIHRNALESCRNGQLCRMRRWADDSEYSNIGDPTRLLLKLGKRESPVCVRVYDKGLQKKLDVVGHWERLEVEFKEDRARTLAERLLQHPRCWPEALSKALLGAVDFRLANGRSETQRRPRARWWADLIDGFSCDPIRPSLPQSSFETWWAWARSSFVPRYLQFCEIMMVAPDVLIDQLCAGIKPSQTHSPATLDLRNQVCAGLQSRADT